MRSDEEYMREAIALAQTARRLGETPVGAVVVRKSDGEIVGRGYNRRETDKNALAHAEIAAIAEASRVLGGWRLIGCEIFVTLEPCPMCAGAIIAARLERVVFGAFDGKAGSVETVQKMFELPYNHKPKVTSGVLENECAEELRGFFKELRGRK